MNVLDALINAIGELFTALFRLAGELVGLSTGRLFKRDGKLTATFAPAGELISRWNKGFPLTGHRALSRKDSYRHVIAFAPSGAGKSTVLSLPASLRMADGTCSLVFHDPSGEVMNNSHAYLLSRGYEVRVLNLANPDNSDRFNPMHRVRKSADMRKLASMIVRHAMGGDKADAFWDQSSASLVAVLGQVLAHCPPEYRNLYNVRHLVNALAADPASLDELFSRHADDELFSEYAAIQAMEHKVLSGVIASARAALDLWADEDVVWLTSSDTMDFDLRERPIALFIRSHIAQLDYYSVIVSIFFEQLLAHLMQELPSRSDLDVFMVIDEAAALRIPVLSSAISNLRKYRVGLELLYQDYSQLVHIYGRYEAETIRQNAFVRVHFGGASSESSTELEKMMGKYEAEDEDGRHRVRPLLTADEIRVLPKNRALIIAAGHRPIIGKLCPYYAQSRLRKRSAMPMPPQEEKEPMSKASRLDLKEPHAEPEAEKVTPVSGE